MSIVAVDPAEQARFDAAYDAEALRNARRLAEYGAPGEAIYRKARGDRTGDAGQGLLGPARQC